MGLETAAIMAIAAGVAGVAAAGATAYSAGREAKAAKRAAHLQAETADKQIAAVKQQEIDAQATAQTKLKAAQARRTKTILTGPELDEPDVNTKSALGV